jgi:hypothetical protein
MKKILSFFGIFALFLTSCSSDDNNDDASVSIKPSKITNSYQNSDYDFSTDIKYDGNKILSQTDDDGEVIKYTYTGDVITKVEYFDVDQQLRYATEYIYTNGKVTSKLDKNYILETKKASSTYYKTKYTYNVDSTISTERFYVNSESGTEEQTGLTEKITIKDRNYIKSENSYFDSEQDINIYEYDSKNNPFRNVTGLYLLIDWETEGSRNNVTKETILIPESVEKNTVNTQISIYSYTYDSNDFPTERNYTDNNGIQSETRKYTY